MIDLDLELKVRQLQEANEKLRKENETLIQALNRKEMERREHRDALQQWADSYAMHRPEYPSTRDAVLWLECTQKFLMRVPLGEPTIIKNNWLSRLKKLIEAYHPEKGGDLHRDLRQLVADLQEDGSVLRVFYDRAQELGPYSVTTAKDVTLLCNEEKCVGVFNDEGCARFIAGAANYYLQKVAPL